MEASTSPTPEDLERAIEQLVNLGEKDPLSIARKLINRYGETWARLEVAARAEEVISDLARKKLGANRRSAEIALRPGDEISQGNMRIAKAWIPGVGWKVAAELTISDCIRKSNFYSVLEYAARRRADWYREVAALMEAEGAETLGKLKADLPALPEGEEPLQLGEAS